MGFRFRKSIRIGKGLRINLGKGGITSVSVGGRGASVNIGKRGTHLNVGLPGSGLSYRTRLGQTSAQAQQLREQRRRSPRYLLLSVGIFFMPYIFYWFVFQEKYPKPYRIVCSIWVAFFAIMVLIGAFA